MFKNLNKSIMSDFVPAWQQETMNIVERDFSAQAREVNRAFHAELLEKLGRSIPEAAGSIVNDLARETPRFAYIKNIDGDGKLWDAQIDLLYREVSFLEI